MAQRPRWCLIVLTGLIVLFILQYWPTVYVVRGNGGGALFWNANEAFVFLGENSNGLRESLLRYVADPFLVALGRVYPSETTICSRMPVIRITSTEIKTYDHNISGDPDDRGCRFGEEVFRGQLYAIAWPAMWRWTGTEFVRPTPEEYGAYAEASAAQKTIRPIPWSFDNVEGWSMRDLSDTAHDFSILVGGQSIRLVYHGETSPRMPVSLELARPGESPHAIWSFDGRPHRVSKAEYEKLFRMN